MNDEDWLDLLDLPFNISSEIVIRKTRMQLKEWEKFKWRVIDDIERQDRNEMPSDYDGSDEESSSSSEDEVMVDECDHEGSNEEISSSTEDEVMEDDGEAEVDDNDFEGTDEESRSLSEDTVMVDDWEAGEISSSTEDEVMVDDGEAKVDDSDFEGTDEESRSLSEDEVMVDDGEAEEDMDIEDDGSMVNGEVRIRIEDFVLDIAYRVGSDPDLITWNFSLYRPYLGWFHSTTYTSQVEREPLLPHEEGDNLPQLIGGGI